MRCTSCWQLRVEIKIPGLFVCQHHPMRVSVVEMAQKPITSFALFRSPRCMCASNVSSLQVDSPMAVSRFTVAQKEIFQNPDIPGSAQTTPVGEARALSSQPPHRPRCLGREAGAPGLRYYAVPPYPYTSSSVFLHFLENKG